MKALRDLQRVKLIHDKEMTHRHKAHPDLTSTAFCFFKATQKSFNTIVSVLALETMVTAVITTATYLCYFWIDANYTEPLSRLWIIP